MAIDVTLLDPTSDNEMPSNYIRVQTELSFRPPGTTVVCTIVDSENAEIYRQNARYEGDGVWLADISGVEFEDGYYTVTATGTAGSDTDEDTATCVFVGEPPDPCPNKKS